MSAQVIELPRFGATQEEWSHFTLLLGLTADLLPVVSNPKAQISPDSKMKSLGKTPSRYNQQRKVAGIANWTSHVASDVDIARWQREPDYGICVQTRNVRAIDVDVDDGFMATEIAAHTPYPAAMPRRTRSGSSKFLYAFKLEGDYTKRILRTSKGAIEFLASGQQFIAAGTHPSGKRYEWEGGLPEEIPTLTAEEFESWWATLEERFAIEPSIERNSSSKSTKISEAAQNDETAKALYARSLVLGNERDGRLHIECPFANEHTTPSSISATSYFPANTGGYAQGHFKCLHAHCERRSDDEFRAALGLGSTLDDFDDVVEVADAAQPKVVQPARFPLVQAAAFAARPQGPQIIKDVWPAVELIVIYGESTSGKSFITLDMACAVARGIPWRSKKTIQGRGVYVVAEGASGFQNRLKAYAQANGIALENLDLFILGDAPNLMLVPDVKELIASIRAHGPVSFVVIDTLAQTMVGGEENSAQDMGKVVKHCKEIHKRTGATVILIHHSGKDATKGARGSSALRAATDAEIEVVRADVERVATVTKLKDGADGAEFGFRLAVVTVGMDIDSEDVTSCVVEHTEVSISKATKRREPKGTNEKAVLRAVRDCMGLAGDAAKAADIIEAGVALLQPPEEGKRDTRRQQIVRALDGLVADGTLRQVEGGGIELCV